MSKDNVGDVLSLSRHTMTTNGVRQVTPLQLQHKPQFKQFNYWMHLKFIVRLGYLEIQLPTDVCLIYDSSI